MDVDDEASAYAPRAVLDTGDLIGEQEPSVDDFPGGPVVKNLPANTGDIRTTSSSSIPGLGRSPGGWHGNPLWYSCLENPMD